LKKESNIQVYDTERQMLDVFITKLHNIDPDMIVAHNLCGGMFEIILARIGFFKIKHWSRIGRFRRS
jgi:DNA polymerase alpha subunit A